MITLNKEKEIAEKYNSAIESHCAEAEFYAYHDGNPVLEAEYFVEEGLEALRKDGWEIYNVESRRPIKDFDEKQEPKTQIALKTCVEQEGDTAENS